MLEYVQTNKKGFVRMGITKPFLGAGGGVRQSVFEIEQSRAVKRSNDNSPALLVYSRLWKTVNILGLIMPTTHATIRVLT